MLIGEYRHNLDDKKRISVPANFRKELGKKVIISRGFDKCLFVHPLSEWQRFTEELEKMPVGRIDSRDLARFIFAGAAPTEIDSLGRILIPDFLKNFAELKTKVVVVGVSRRLELWDETKWEENTQRIEGQADLLAEKMGELGMF
ncbi:MAG: division/cell wall cluster transcriptional repressor MraZ [Candidatus Vogelbacteria bacterium CG22_combo_CG10-13_8_21_14_all_37_9]|uniref:Transcriptional regulator MraZ n=1 Tax=Candidatus Vogelbacteria bacterium CG22_combo_CG10-13_8_21_14_all_37_9 TaxID=1975046 RepID=A0A2H0BN97_9BACT|nr:MAG: cell division/cell wall cluster transcriptional repressor MraZ [bacterium CG10_37_50]PIP58478.1 MAG: division/cell wall cluster transcriptional repressor MraZ [Candidatus Vogelbacteria bacterium CG22_combo_CG10-13_8_21_14_all_37_9]